MNIDVKRVKIIVTVPLENSEDVRNAICNEGAGIIGNYTDCTISTKCIGTFKPSDIANPYIGEKNKLEFVKEEKLEQRTTIVLSGVMFVAGFTIAGLNVRYQWLILPNWVI